MRSREIPAHQPKCLLTSGKVCVQKSPSCLSTTGRHTLAVGSIARETPRLKWELSFAKPASIPADVRVGWRDRPTELKSGGRTTFLQNPALRRRPLAMEMLSLVSQRLQVRATG